MPHRVAAQYFFGLLIFSHIKKHAGTHQSWVKTMAGFQHRLPRSEEHTSELQSRENLVCRLLLEKKKSALCRNSVADWDNRHHRFRDQRVFSGKQVCSLRDIITRNYKTILNHGEIR